MHSVVAVLCSQCGQGWSCGEPDGANNRTNPVSAKQPVCYPCLQNIHICAGFEATAHGCTAPVGACAIPLFNGVYILFRLLDNDKKDIPLSLHTSCATAEHHRLLRLALEPRGMGASGYRSRRGVGASRHEHAPALYPRSCNGLMADMGFFYMDYG